MLRGKFFQTYFGAAMYLQCHVRSSNLETSIMAHQDINNYNTQVKIIEQCEVAPPPSSFPSTITLPLTFLDIAWFLCHQVQRIFFFDFPHPTHHFLQTAVPILKHSLSLTLHHFFPFASNLIVPPNLHLSHIRYLNGDSLPFIVAQSSQNFTVLISDSPQDVRNWHPLVPTLPPARVQEDGTSVIPLMAIQVTVLPNSGFSIGLTFDHVAGDGKSLHHFIKFWASVCKSKGDLNLASLQGSLSLPSHERDRVKDPKGLKLRYSQKVECLKAQNMDFKGLMRDVYTNKVRSTIVLSRDEQVEKLKKWLCFKCAHDVNCGGENDRVSGSLHMSTFVVTCTLIWVCLIKSEDRQGNFCDDDQVCRLLFLADCRGHHELLIPRTYFGNCVVPCIVEIKRSDIVGENGMVVVANAVESEIRAFKSGAMRKTETMMPDYIESGKPINSLVVIAGSLKLAVYETDFGWGKPKKSEAVHIDSSWSISFSDCRDAKGGIEVGLALEEVRMNNFVNILEEQLNNIRFGFSPA